MGNDELYMHYDDADRGQKSPEQRPRLLDLVETREAWQGREVQSLISYNHSPDSIAAQIRERLGGSLEPLLTGAHPPLLVQFPVISVPQHLGEAMTVLQLAAVRGQSWFEASQTARILTDDTQPARQAREILFVGGERSKAAMAARNALEFEEVGPEESNVDYISPVTAEVLNLPVDLSNTLALEYVLRDETKLPGGVSYQEALAHIGDEQYWAQREGADPKLMKKLAAKLGAIEGVTRGDQADAWHMFFSDLAKELGFAEGVVPQELQRALILCPVNATEHKYIDNYRAWIGEFTSKMSLRTDKALSSFREQYQVLRGIYTGYRGELTRTSSTLAGIFDLQVLEAEQTGDFGEVVNLLYAMGSTIEQITVTADGRYEPILELFRQELVAGGISETELRHGFVLEAIYLRAIASKYFFKQKGEHMSAGEKLALLTNTYTQELPENWNELLSDNSGKLLNVLLERLYKELKRLTDSDND